MGILLGKHAGKWEGEMGGGGSGSGEGGETELLRYTTGLDPGRFFPTLSFSGLAWGGTVANFFLCFILFFFY